MTIIHASGVGMAQDASLLVAPIYDPISSSDTGVPVYAGVEFNVDGSQDRTPPDTPTSSYTSPQGDYIKIGVSSEVWVEVTLTDGTFNSEDGGAGGGRLACTSVRRFRIVRNTNGFQVATATFAFYNHATAGELLRTGSIFFQAFRG